MSKSTRCCIIDAPCKINLHLGIGEKVISPEQGNNGFHNIESIFAALSFGDTLSFEIIGKNANLQGENTQFFLNMELPGEDVPLVIKPEKNLVLRAVSLFREQTGFAGRLKIRLDKRIPLGSGLGGGSSNAASTLLALNSLSGAALSAEKLHEMAAILGSDVPFFLYGGAAFVSGRGEIIEPVKTLENLWVVLAKPPFSSDTGEAFHLLDQARKNPNFPQNFAPLRLRVKNNKEMLIRALEDDPANWPFYNDFLPVFLESKEGQKAKMYKTILELLQKTGACFTGLSGAGSCCFGIFKARETAEMAEKTLKKQKFFTKLTFFLAL